MPREHATATATDNVVSIAGARLANSDWERFKYNVALGYKLIDAGIPVFVTDQNKHPLILDFNSLDSDFDANTRRDIIADDLEQRRQKFIDTNEREPVIGTDIREKRFVGATLDKKTFNKMMMAFRKLEPVPGVSVWPAGLAVVDIDERKYPGAIEMIEQAFASHGLDVSGFPINATRSGGRHIYTRCETAIESNDVKYQGKLWGDVKGKTQVIAVGAVLANGQTYGNQQDLQRLCEMYKAGTIPPLPKFVADMVGTRRSGEGNSTSEREVQALMTELRQTDLPDAGELLEPALGGFDMPKIEQRYPKFREAIDAHNFSDIRFNLAGALKAERADVTAAQYEAILFEREDCGEFVDDDKAVAGVSYNRRSVARDFLRAVPLASEASTGETFAAVEDEDDDAGVPAEHLRMQANIARKAEREAAERELEVEVVKIKAEIAELDEAKDAKPEAPKTEASKTKVPVFLRSMDIFENFTPPDELIEGLLPAIGTACIVADSNVGKTFFAIHMLDTIMRGDKFFGRNVECGGALMVAGEGRSGLNKRFAALHKERPYLGGRGNLVAPALSRLAHGNVTHPSER